MARQVEDLAVPLMWLGLLLWLGFSPWPGNFCMLWAWPKKKKALGICAQRGIDIVQSRCGYEFSPFVEH